MSQIKGAEWRKPDVCQPTGSAELAMLDVYMPMMKTSAIVSAGRLGLFEALSDGPLSLAVLAERLASSQRGLGRLCDFLVALPQFHLVSRRCLWSFKTWLGRGTS